MIQLAQARSWPERFGSLAPIDTLRREVDHLSERFDGGAFHFGAWGGDGRVLKVTMPKAAELQVKRQKIEIKTAA